jgi:hypothetical protein
VSSVTPCVGDRTPHQQSPDKIKERQAASLGLGLHHGDDLVNAFRSLALVWPPLVHLLCLGSALARWRRLNAKAFQKTG